MLKISFLLFRLLPSLLYKISFFSFRQILHFLVIGLKGGALSTRLHWTLYGIPSSFKFQTWLLRQVLILYFLLFMSQPCLECVSCFSSICFYFPSPNDTCSLALALHWASSRSSLAVAAWGLDCLPLVTLQDLGIVPRNGLRHVWNTLITYFDRYKVTIYMLTLIFSSSYFF